MTEASRDFLASTHEILETFGLAKRMAQRQSPTKGSISIAATYTVIGYFLPPHLDSLQHMYPNLDIRSSELNREGIEERLLSNRFELAVVLTSNVTNSEQKTKTLLRVSR